MLTNRLETLILKNLICSEDYSRKVLPFIKDEYFEDASERLIFNQCKSFILTYNTSPTFEALSISINRVDGVNADVIKGANDILSEIKSNNEKTDDKWMIDNTEKFCQDRAIYNAVSESINILDKGYKGTKTKAVIPEILSKALGVCFDTNVGHDYLEDVDMRYEFYHRIEERIPFDLDVLNKITKGGVPKKTLTCIMAPTGIGKSLFMCHMATACLAQGKNVLYITAEMAEEKIAERIDANLLNIPLDDLVNLPKDIYEKKVAKAKEKTAGKLIIKEYPTAQASATHIKTLLNELLLKKNFKPDIVFTDYLNIFTSARYKLGASVGTYSYIKAIAEEFRGLAVEYNFPMITATQVNREGMKSTDLDLTNVSESIGLPATCDFLLGVVSTEDMERKNQILVLKLKHRDSDPLKYKKFILGIDRSKMRLYDVQEDVQQTIVDTGQPKTKFSGIKT